MKNVNYILLVFLSFSGFDDLIGKPISLHQKAIISNLFLDVVDALCKILSWQIDDSREQSYSRGRLIKEDVIKYVDMYISLVWLRIIKSSLSYTKKK